MAANGNQLVVLYTQSQVVYGLASCLPFTYKYPSNACKTPNVNLVKSTFNITLSGPNPNSNPKPYSGWISSTKMYR